MRKLFLEPEGPLQGKVEESASHHIFYLHHRLPRAIAGYKYLPFHSSLLVEEYFRPTSYFLLLIAHFPEGPLDASIPAFILLSSNRRILLLHEIFWGAE